MEKYQSSLQTLLKEYPYLYEVVIISIVVLCAYLIYFITHRVLIRSVQKITSKTKSDLDDILLNKKLLHRLSYILPIIFIRQFNLFTENIDKVVHNIWEALIIFFLTISVTAFIDGAVIAISRIEKFKDRPLKSYAQVVKIIIYVIAIIFIIGVITDQSPWSIFAGLGALSAVILLVFKDTILSFVASIQISSYDLVKVGDWIEMPKLGVDGDVMDISLHTIKIRNFDKTITVIPTKSVVETPFKNWRGMTETGGRRIKRSIFIDQASIKLVNEEMLNRFKKIQILSAYIEKKEKEIEDYNNQHQIDGTVKVNGRRMTNVGTFRAYLKEYLKQREDIHKELTFLVRQLPPSPNGLPMEIYVFTNTTAWVQYEDIQADIFDHLLAVVNEFELELFQSPAGTDIRQLSKASNKL